MRLGSRLGPILLIFALIAALALALAGIASWPVLVAASLPWFLVAAKRMGVTLAAVVVILVCPFLFLLGLMVTGLLGLPMLGSAEVAAVVIGGLGTALCARTDAVFRRPARATLAIWLPALLGGVAWLTTVALAWVVPGASRFSWVMMGDAANNILFAREVVYRDGLAVGAAENPVPLPSAVLGFVIAAGRSDVPPSELIRHDILGFVTTWTLLIVLSCLVLGAAAGVIVRLAGGSPPVVGAVSAGASLLPLSWFVTGYPVEYGFFSTHFAFVVIFAALIAYLFAPERPAVSLGLLGVAATLLLAIWSPLVLLPMALGVVVLIRFWRRLTASRGRSLLWLTVGLGQVLLYGLAVVLPSLLHQGYFLSAQGGVIGFHRWMVAALAVSALGLAAVAFRSSRDLVLVGVAALVAGCALGLGALVVVSGSWSYYPLKFAWLASSVMLVLVLALGAAAAVRTLRRPRLRALGLATVAAAVAGFLVWAPSSLPSLSWMDPVPRVLTDSFHGVDDHTAQEIFALADPTQSRMLWNSKDPDELTINFWLLQLWSESVSENFALRTAAYGYFDMSDPAELCRIVDLMGGGTVVHTADPQLVAQVRETCPEQSIVVVVGGAK